MDFGLDSWVSIPSRKEVFLYSTVFRPALRPSQPPIQWVLGALSQGVKQLEGESDHSAPSEVKHGGAIPPLPHISSWCDDNVTLFQTFMKRKNSFKNNQIKQQG
jgi:hypothetical protein